MTITTKDVQTFIHLLADNAEARTQLGGMLAADLLRKVEAVLQDVVAGQRQSDQRLARVETALAALAEAQGRTEVAMARLDEALTNLAHEQALTQVTIRDMNKGMTVLQRRSGHWIEAEYRDKAPAYFGAILRRVRVVAPNTMEDELEARLSRENYLDLLRVDILVSGQPRDHRELGEVWLAVEVSGVVDDGDVARAIRRAGHLVKAGLRAIPAVAGEQLTDDALMVAAQEGVLCVQDGHLEHWEDALARHAAA